MNQLTRALQTGLLLASAAAAHAQMQFDTSLAVFTDDEDGSSFDVDASLSPNENWTFSLGAGTSDSSSDSADVSGDALRAAADVHNERFGARAYYESWSAADSFDTDTLGARLYYNTPGGVSLTLIAEDKSHEPQFDDLSGPGNQLPSNSQVDAIGYGGGVSWYGSSWGGYVEGIFYDFDDALDDLRVVSTTTPRNRGQAKKVTDLVNSVVTATQGALDSQLSAGIERSLDRVNIHADWLAVEDAVDGVKSSSYSGGVRYSFTQSLDAGVILGISDGDNTGSIGFAGFTLAYRR
jgi:hypothetical protein